MFEFKLITEQELPQILVWRTSKFVTQYMFTDIEFSPSAQKNWFEKISEDVTSCYWVIVYQGKPIGVLNVDNIQLSNRCCTWGFYIGEESARNLGGLVPPYLYNFIFNKTPINQITAEVMGHNLQVKKLHKLHGYEHVNLLENHIVKSGTTFNVEVYQLNKLKWLAQKRFAKFHAEFEVNHLVATYLNINKCVGPTKST
jgi:UDP-4-amino-4,6-dideoxy-N-acetyl-beta-L-altrosamine N-acetyltransferase